MYGNGEFLQWLSDLWDHGTLTDLGTLPRGYNSFSMGVNNHGEVVGSAQNTVPDPN